MQQYDITPRNLSERIRKRAWKRIEQGDLKGYERLTALSLEAHAIRSVGPEIVHVG